ncbi:MAG: hypothetical protein J5645_09520 [Lachnospiraceae bacterium]|nr:hypothetical protein [Lachnospiraceae bacterium]
MNVKRLLAVLLVFLSLFAICACDGNSGKSNPSENTAKPTATSTPTPTPTEIPKSPEQEDFETITRLFESADNTIAGTKDSAGTLPAGTRFTIRFEDDHLATGFETTDAGFQRRIWQSWIQSAGLSRANHPLQSELYQTSCKYGSIIGVLDDSGKINWTAGNLSEEMFAKLSAFGVEKDAEYLHRVELLNDIKGVWSGTYNMTMEILVDNFMEANDELGRDYYLRLSNFLKQYGFSGSFKFSARCSFLNEKELLFSINVDMSSFFDSLHKAASNKSSMTQMVCVLTMADERSVNAYLRQENTDIMSFGNRLIRTMEGAYNEAFAGLEEEYCPYTSNGTVLDFEGTKNRDRISYNRDRDTMTYYIDKLEMIMKRE